MKKLILSIISVLSLFVSLAQQKQGKVIYSRSLQMQVQISGDQAMQQAMPRSRTDKFELTFGDNKSIWKHMDEEMNAEEISGNGMQIRMVAPGQNEIIFYDFANGVRIDQREFFDKKFIITDTVQKLNWKLTGEIKNILGHNCQQAIAQRTGIRSQMRMENGKMERKDVTDTSNIVAWFASDIPVTAGPEVPGQLPGLILALDVNNGRMVYQAIEISDKANIASIVPPVKGKKVSQEQYVTERNKMMEEMGKNNGGRGNTIIRMN